MGRRTRFRNCTVRSDLLRSLSVISKCEIPLNSLRLHKGKFVKKFDVCLRRVGWWYCTCVASTPECCFQSNISSWLQHQRHSFVRFVPHSTPEYYRERPRNESGRAGVAPKCLTIFVMLVAVCSVRSKISMDF